MKKNFRVHYTIKYPKRKISGSYLAFDVKSEDEAKGDCVKMIAYTHDINEDLVTVDGVEEVKL